MASKALVPPAKDKVKSVCYNTLSQYQYIPIEYSTIFCFGINNKSDIVTRRSYSRGLYCTADVNFAMGIVERKLKGNTEHNIMIK